MRILGTIIILLYCSSIGLAQRTVRDHMRVGNSQPDSTGTYFFSIPENEDFDYLVGDLGITSNMPSGVLDNDLFYLRNDSLFTRYSFDYEGFLPNPLQVVVSNATGLDTVVINITDVSGKWDTNGKADADIANKYENVKLGDYIVWNYTSGMDLQLAVPSIASGKKILIQGKAYDKIELDLQNCAGSGVTNRTIVTNFLGQVQTKDGIVLDNATYVRITGQYDPINFTGHRYFPGCDKNGSSVSFGYAHGTFGIYYDNEWQSETSGTGLEISSNNTGVEIDHLELGNGGFTAISIGWKNTYSIADNTHIHHNFIHDVGSQGIVLGVLGSFPQQIFTNCVIENNALVRCGGECLQTAWISSGSIVRNNFMHGATDWKDPFARWQDGVIEWFSLGGDIDVQSNILIGGGYRTMNLTTRNNNTPFSYELDTLRFFNNLVYRNRSNVAVFAHSTSDTLTQLKFDGNYFGKLGYDLDEVYPIGDTTNNKALGLHTKPVSIVVSNNSYDFSIENLTGGSASPTFSNNKKLNIPVPEFENYLGTPVGFNYLKVNRYASVIGSSTNFPNTGTNKGDPASWEVNDIVQTSNNQGKTRFYKCLQATNNSSNNPPVDDSSNSTWQLMTWLKPDGSTSYFPPDDIKLKGTNYYFTQRGIGVSDSVSNNPPPPPPPIPNIPPVVSIANPLDKSKLGINDTINILASASDPDGAVFSVKLFVNGQLNKIEYFAPYNNEFIPTATGSYEFFAIAYDSDGDSTISDTVTVYILNPNAFNVLNFTKHTGVDHGTTNASQNMLDSLGTLIGFNVDLDSTGTSFNSLSSLQNYSVIIFSNTTGNNLLSGIQRANFESYMQNGGSMVGIHAVVDAHRHATANGTGTGTWDWLPELVGASSNFSPSETSSGTTASVQKVNSHSSVDFLSNTFNYTGAFPYFEGGYFDSTVTPILKVQSTGSQSYDAPRYLAWYKYLSGGGKLFYTGLGHSSNEFDANPNFQNHILQAILWAQANALPEVSIINIQNGDTVYKNDDIEVQAVAYDPDGNIDSVSFEVDNVTYATDADSAYKADYVAKKVGVRNLSVTAYDNDGGKKKSQIISIHVVDTTAPFQNGRTYADLDPYFTHVYTADSSLYTFNPAHVVSDGDTVMMMLDRKQVHDVKWIGDRFSIVLPSIPPFHDDAAGKYIFFQNSKNQVYNKEVPPFGLPAEAHYLVMILEGPGYEGYTQKVLGYRDRRNGGSYELKWTGSPEFSDGGRIDVNRYTWIRIKADVNGQAKMWLNGVPYNGGQTLNVGTGTRKQLGYGTPSHIGEHIMFGSWYLIGDTFNNNEMDSIETIFNDLFDLGAPPPAPIADSIWITWDNNLKRWEANYEYLNTLGIPEDPSRVEYQWFAPADTSFPGTNVIDIIKQIPGANGKYLKRADYPYWFPPPYPSKHNVYLRVKVYDIQDNTWRFLRSDSAKDLAK